MANLLLVDNDARITDLTAWFLKRAGHEVECAISYADAREVLRTRRPDLLLADLDLGEESGREELPKLAREGLLPKTLVVSGFLDATIATELLAIPGVLGTVSKPFEMEGLEREITKAIEGAAPVAPAQEATDAPALEEDDDEDGWVEIVPFESPSTRLTEREERLS